MSISLITKGMICQGNLVINTVQAFITPFLTKINLKTVSANIRIIPNFKINLKVKIPTFKIVLTK
jgi:hypothetical protein